MCPIKMSFICMCTRPLFNKGIQKWPIVVIHCMFNVYLKPFLLMFDGSSVILFFFQKYLTSHEKCEYFSMSYNLL